MKRKSIMHALNDLDQDLVYEASEEQIKKRKRHRFKKWGAIAASFILISGTVLVALNHQNTNTYLSHKQLQAMTILEAKYPNGYSYEDYDTKSKIIDENKVSDQTIQAINKFSYQTASKLFENSASNQIYSPISLYYALAMAATGAKGDTLDQILSVMGQENTSNMGMELNHLYQLLYTKNEYSTLQIADSLWVSNRLKSGTFKQEYIDAMKQNYFASLYSVDFGDQETGKVMKQWISENTKGTLEYDYQPNADRMLSILNTIYFYDEWVDRFDSSKTKEDIFHTESKEEQKMEFMNRVEVSHGFSVGDNFVKSSLSLKNDAEMVFILPNEGVSVSELVATPESIQKCFEEGEVKSGKVTWKIPKFKYGSSMDLNSMLQSLGVEKAFDAKSADFTGITDEQIWIDTVKQNAHIGIDEKGVEASAYTEIAMCGSAMPVDEAQMILDRPFVYGIVKDGVVLFVGVFTGK